MLNVVVKATGTNDAIVKFKALDLSMRNFTAPMTAIGKSLTEYFSNDVYASQGGVLGSAWPTLSLATTKYKAKNFPQYDTTPLIRTGLMKKSYTYNVTPNSVVISNTAPYFKYHQSTQPRSKIPYRPSMGINDPVKLIITTIIKADIEAKMEAA